MESQERAKRKLKKGTVVSDKMNKTVVVSVSRRIRHAQYGKVVGLGQKYYAHDESNQAKVGDTVTIMETRPTSKLKRWRVVPSES
jgi:small subunit ribosomal protein S17